MTIYHKNNQALIIKIIEMCVHRSTLFFECADSLLFFVYFSVWTHFAQLCTKKINK